MLTKTRANPTREICIASACNALAGAIAAMTIDKAALRPAAVPRNPADSPRARARKSLHASQLDMLKMRLAIFVYGHPVVNLLQVLDAIERARTTGEVQMLLDYILRSRGHAARSHPDHSDG